MIYNKATSSIPMNQRDLEFPVMSAEDAPLPDAPEGAQVLSLRKSSSTPVLHLDKWRLLDEIWDEDEVGRDKQFGIFLDDFRWTGVRSSIFLT